MTSDDEYIIINPGFGKPRFGKEELRDIGIAVVVLTLAFTILYRNNQVVTYLDSVLHSHWKAMLALFGMCAVITILSFLFHELAHKFVAQKAGLWSEFRMWPIGIGLTLITSFLGFLFAAPGAVCISGSMDKSTNGKISIAGPAVNLVISAIAIGLCMLVNHTPWIFPCLMLANLNAFLALFNLLPIPPLDGSKVITWNPLLWIIALAISIMELFAVMSNTWYFG